MTRPAIRTGLLALSFLATAALPASAQMSPQQREAARACMPDIRAYCSNVEYGNGRILACLQMNRARLSAPCQQAMSTAGR